MDPGGTALVVLTYEVIVSVIMEVRVEVPVMVVGERDRGTRIRVADTRTPASRIATATYARLLFPLFCNATAPDIDETALTSVNTFVRTDSVQ